MSNELAGLSALRSGPRSTNWPTGSTDHFMALELVSRFSNFSGPPLEVVLRLGGKNKDAYCGCFN